MSENECRRIVAERSGGVCERCLRRRATNMAHRKPRSQGGLWEPANIVHLCGVGNHNNGSCHGWQENDAAIAHTLGWRLWRDEDPLSVPIRVHPRAAWLLTNDGRRLVA